MNLKDQQKGFWAGLEEKEGNPEYKASVQQEFKELPVVGTLSDDKILDTRPNRRDFLKYLGFGLGAATVAAGCESPLKKAMPYVTKPDSIVPGVASYFASTFVDAGNCLPILVKTREGRPIKIEGNPSSKMTGGGTSARAQAMVLSLYDTNRFQAPMMKKEDAFAKTTWEDLDKAVKAALNPGSRVRIVSNTILSPTAKQALAEFTAKYPNTKVVQYDAISSTGMLIANEQCFGQKAVPSYHFDRADVIVSFNADFLGTWISPVEYAHQYAKGRKVTDVAHAKMSQHVQVEAHMSLTGSNADNRILVKPSEQGAAILALYNALGGGGKSLPLTGEAGAKINALAKKLTANKGKCLVVCGNNDTNQQILVNKINDILGSYGSTIDFGAASMQRQGDDREVQTLVKEMQAGQVDALFVMGANPVYDLPNAKAFAAGMAKVKTTVAMDTAPNETGKLCGYIAPSNHQLESWGDAQPKKGMYTMVQPTISPLFKTRQAEASLLTWAESANYNASSEQPYMDYVMKNWATNMFPQQTAFLTAQSFWDNCLHDGVFSLPQNSSEAVAFAGDAGAAAAKIEKPLNAEIEVAFYETVNIGAGQHGDNPWLQEMPDPVLRTVWGSYLSVPITFNAATKGYTTLNGLKSYMDETDLADVEVAGVKQRFPVVPSFGQMQGTVSIPVGYGRQDAGFASKDIGNDVYPWLTINKEGLTQYFNAAVVSDKVGTDEEYATVQYHHTIGVFQGDDKKTMVDEIEVMPMREGYQGGLTDRSILFHGHVDDAKEVAHKIQDFRTHANKLNSYTLYPGYDDMYKMGHHWGMSIDMNACTGCGACTVACMAENNVPVVGKTEVHRHHEMTWLRIDRYFFGDVDNPNTAYQAVMCQHCDNAPCENVCPVNATNHSSEGLNQMTYNRCVGTRYCANNCPYKVRRFNWFDYTTADLFPSNEPTVNGEAMPFGADNLTRMVLNPDVTVRSRGVIEKCSFCVQRIQEGKLTAKREGRKLRDADVRSACQTACPTGAIVFGDMNNKAGELSKAQANPLAYRLLEEINVQSSVTYNAKLINKDEALA